MARLLEAYRSSDLFEIGVGRVVLARFRGPDDVEVGVFLLDVHCLGVKDAFYTRLTVREYQEDLLDRLLPGNDRMPIDPPTARKLVEGAVAYAERLGFAPHSEHRKACRVFGGIDPAESTATFTFGMEGKPYYVQGPHETGTQALQILRQLRAMCGDGNFDYLIQVDGAQIEQFRREGFEASQTIPVPPDLMP